MINASASLTPPVFEKLLMRLDPDRVLAGRKYETLRAGLMRFFECKGCETASHSADEVLDRVARKIDEGVSIGDVHRFALGVGHFVSMEGLRGRVARRHALRGYVTLAVVSPTPSGQEECGGCVERCLKTLPAAEAQSLLDYHGHEGAKKAERRKQMARELGISVTGLRMRMSRLRARVEECAKHCLG